MRSRMGFQGSTCDWVATDRAEEIKWGHATLSLVEDLAFYSTDNNLFQVILAAEFFSKWNLVWHTNIKLD